MRRKPNTVEGTAFTGLNNRSVVPKRKKTAEVKEFQKLIAMRGCKRQCPYQMFWAVVMDAFDRDALADNGFHVKR